MLPTVAIIMRAENEMPHVKRALEALGRQSFTAYSLHGIDSGSTDGTLELLEKHCDTLTRIAPEEYVPGRIINQAIAKTDLNIIVLLNADAVPLSDTWLEDLVRPIINRKSAVTFCRQEPRRDAHFIVRSDYKRAYNPRKSTDGFFSAVACSFRRELWEKHTFRETGYAEDRDWALDCIKSGAKIELLSNCSVEHSHNYSLKELYQKRFRQAVTLKQKRNTPLQVLCFLKEILRDFAAAVSAFKFHTIPYNLAYRFTIHRAVYNGLKRNGQLHA